MHKLILRFRAIRCLLCGLVLCISVKGRDFHMKGLLGFTTASNGWCLKDGGNQQAYIYGLGIQAGSTTLVVMNILCSDDHADFLPSLITAYSHWYNAKDTCLAAHNTFVFIGIGMMETKESVCGYVLRLHHLPSISVHNNQPYLREVLHLSDWTAHDKYNSKIIYIIARVGGQHRRIFSLKLSVLSWP